MQAIATEILINANPVTCGETKEAYEFIINAHLQVIECIKVELGKSNQLEKIKDFNTLFKGRLFELNHVRINPKLDNAYMTETLTKAFKQIGVQIRNKPHHSSMAICYKPLGEISDNIRFYLSKEVKLIFLSPAMRPRLVYSKKKP